jgi:hypothetical protein
MARGPGEEMVGPSQDEPKRRFAMNIRIGLLLASTLMAINSGPAHAALEPADPDKAPIAAVDRFSQKAAILLVRSADDNLPGANEPIDFDTPALSTFGLSPKGDSVLYYDLDVQSTTPAPIYALYREGEDKPVQGQLDIIDTLPGEQGYNDFRQVWKVWVPKDYVANTITDAQMLQQAGYKMEKTDKLFNMPVVPDKSRALALQRRNQRTSTGLVSRPSRKVLQL